MKLLSKLKDQKPLLMKRLRQCLCFVEVSSDFSHKLDESFASNGKLLPEKIDEPLGMISSIRSLRLGRKVSTKMWSRTDIIQMSLFTSAADWGAPRDKSVLELGWRLEQKAMKCAAGYSHIISLTFSCMHCQIVYEFMHEIWWENHVRRRLTMERSASRFNCIFFGKLPKQFAGWGKSIAVRWKIKIWSPCGFVRVSSRGEIRMTVEAEFKIAEE